MSQEKQFYVYVHRYASGPKQGEVFYVGKGKGNRLKSISKRNPHWRNIVNKYGFTHHIMAHFHNEECAFSFERALIAFYGRENLCNMTDGGEGVSGRVISIDERLKRALSQAGRKHSPDTIEKMSAYQTAYHPMRGRKHSADTIAKFQKRSGRSHSLFDPTERCFLHSDGTVFVGTRYDLNITYNLDPSSTSKMLSGKIKHHKGWVELK